LFCYKTDIRSEEIIDKCLENTPDLHGICVFKEYYKYKKGDALHTVKGDNFREMTVFLSNVNAHLEQAQRARGDVSIKTISLYLQAISSEFLIGLGTT